MGISELKKKSGKSGMEDLKKKLQGLTSFKPDKEKNYEDDRFWEMTEAKDKTGSAIIRFLPAAEGEDQPFVEYIEYFFQGVGGWYTEKSLESIGMKDPVKEEFSKLWQTQDKKNQDIAKGFKRTIKYVSNILVIKDPICPQNEGKVFLYKYGKQIMDMVKLAMYPIQDDLDEEKKEGINIFCPWEGANFKLRRKIKDGFRTYETSEFATPTPLLDGNDSAIEELWKTEYKLDEFINPDNYKSYDYLKQKLNRVLGYTKTEETTEDFSVPKPKKLQNEVSSVVEEPKSEEVDDDIDSLFAELDGDSDEDKIPF